MPKTSIYNVVTHWPSDASIPKSTTMPENMEFSSLGKIAQARAEDNDSYEGNGLLHASYYVTRPTRKRAILP